MKLKKYLFLTLFVFLTVSYSQAQEKTAPEQIDVSISVKETKISFYAKSVLVDLKIINNSSKAIDTERLGASVINFSKTFDGKTIDKTETAFFELESKILNKGESFTTQIDLNKLTWLKNYSNSNSKAEYKPLLLGSYFLSVEINDREGISPVERQLLANDERVGLASTGTGNRSNSITSNRILLDFLTPARSR